MRAILRSWMRNAALIAFGLVLGLCVLEAALQVGALLLLATEDATPATWLGMGRRILCLGDSNTYGVYLNDRGAAYPAQLERMWNAAAGAAPIEVLNLGYPGTNSSLLRRNLPRMLETFQPDMVIVMIGANDFWTAPVPIDETAEQNGVVQFLKRYSRTYKLVYMLQRAFDRRSLEVERNVNRDGGKKGALRYGDTEFPMGFKPAPRRFDNDRQMLENLRAIVGATRAVGAEPLLMTYPSRAANYGEATLLLRDAARETGTRLVDLAAAFAAVCPAEPCPQWLLADHHPTARGYRRIAVTLMGRLRRRFDSNRRTGSH